MPPFQILLFVIKAHQLVCVSDTALIDTQFIWPPHSTDGSRTG
jgi:hypothetical protein